jgi:hypothetical protein
MKHYLNFCRRFNSSSLPELSIKKINDAYQFHYKILYNVEKEEIDKATFFLLIVLTLVIFFLSLFFTSYNLLLIIFYSISISLIFSYQFNIIVYNKIKKLESEINAHLNLIKIDFSLIRKTYEDDKDLCIAFILKLIEYDLPVKKDLNRILRNIMEGENPEKALKEFITPSVDLNEYIKKLLDNQFKNFNEISMENNYTEKRFKIYIRQMETKMSIIFFLGIFLPIGLCFFILFLPIHFFIVLFLPPYLLILNFLFKKLIKINFYLIGLLNYSSNKEKQKFDEFLTFLREFALNLNNNNCPEVAFINTFNQIRSEIQVLRNIFKAHVSLLLNLSVSFEEVMNSLEYQLKSIHLKILIGSIKKMLVYNSFDASKKIFDILNFISRYRNLEKKLEILIKSEKFKVFIFLILVPIILGAIGGLIPFFGFLSRNLLKSGLGYISSISIVFFDIIITFTTLLLSNTITSYYFLKIVDIKKNYIILLTNFIFILSFLLSLSNLLLV